MIFAGSFRCPVFAALLVLLVSGCSRPVDRPAPAKPEAKPKAAKPVTSFVLDKGGLDLTAPGKWEFNPNPNPDRSEAELHPLRSEKDIPVIVVQAAEVSEEETMQTLIAGFGRHIARGIDDPVITRDQKRQIALPGAEAYHIGYTGKLEGTPVTGAQVLVRRSAWLYVFTAVAQASDWAATEKALDELLAALKATPAAK